MDIKGDEVFVEEVGPWVRGVESDADLLVEDAFLVVF